MEREGGGGKRRDRNREGVGETDRHSEIKRVARKMEREREERQTEDRETDRETEIHTYSWIERLCIPA